MSPALLEPTKPKKSKALPPAVSPFAIHRFTVDEYHKLIDIGVLGPWSKCELIHGWIVSKMPQNPPHSISLIRLNRWFAAHLPTEYLLSPQLPVTADDSEPEPDVSIFPGPESRFVERHPGLSECDLVIEIAESSLAYDRGTKLELYAGSKVPQYWIVNLVDKQVEVYTLPRGGKKPQYKKRVDYKVDDSIPVVLAKAAIGSIPVRDILP